MTVKTKTVLVFVHDFPPAGGAGVQRVLKFVKYLPEFGWRSVVITATPESYTVIDGTLAGDIPADTPILRVPSFDPNKLRPRFERLRLGKALSSLQRRPVPAGRGTDLGPSCAASGPGSAIRDYQPAVIFSSALPASAHMLGLWATPHDRTALGRRLSRSVEREPSCSPISPAIGTSTGRWKAQVLAGSQPDH